MVIVRPLTIEHWVGDALHITGVALLTADVGVDLRPQPALVALLSKEAEKEGQPVRVLSP